MLLGTIIPVLFSLVLPADAANAVSPIDTINECVSQSPGQSPRFVLRGQLLQKNHETIIIKDETAGTIIADDRRLTADLSLGSLIEADVQRDSTRALLHLRNIRHTEPRPYPPPIRIAGGRVASGEFRHNFIETSGVVFSATRDELDSKFNWMLVRTPTGPFMIAVTETDHPLVELQKLADADVIVRGIVVKFATWRRSLGYRLALAGTNAIEIVRDPPRQIADSPLLKGTEQLHRQRTSGRVVAVCRDRFFLSVERHGCIQVRPLAGTPIPRVGDLVTAAGFAELDPLALRLVEATVRINPAAEPPPSERILEIGRDWTFADSNGVGRILFSHNRRIVRTRGLVERTAASPDGVRSFTLKSDRQELTVDISAFADDAIPMPLVGSVVDVTGLFVADFENITDSTVIPGLRGFIVIPRSAADVSLLKRPPWWTPFRLLALIVLLAAIIVAISIWNRTLQSLAERRGRELLEEQIGRVSADLKVNERTRLAVELHDVLSQNLTGVSLQLDAVKRFADEDRGKMTRHLDMAMRALKSCRDELRYCLFDLRNQALEEPNFATAVERTLQPHLNGAKLSVRFNVPRKELHDNTSQALLRAIRELAVNAIRHGKARTIRIAGEYLQGRVRFSVTDDGTGFDTAAVPGPEQGHFGLQGIRERAAERNGTVEIDTHSDRGTRIVVTLMEDSSWQETDE